MFGEYESSDRGGQRRWDLADGTYVLGEPGAAHIRSAETDHVIVRGTDAVAAVIGEDHPAIVECRQLTEAYREEQRAYGRILQDRGRDLRRFGL